LANAFDSSRAYRIVVAEDAYLVREGIRHVLAQADDVEVVAFCTDLGSLLEAVEHHEPDVVVTDIRMPPTNTDEGIRAAAELNKTRPRTGVVVISQYVSPHYAIELFEHGPSRRAYLLKENLRHRNHLVGAIREVASGGSVVDPGVVEALIEARTQTSSSRIAQLTPREREVLAGVAEG
jgi:DNA-binding NarL/FixJ family response regulator